MFKTYSSSSSLVITSRWFATSRLAVPACVRLVYMGSFICFCPARGWLSGWLSRVWQSLVVEGWPDFHDAGLQVYMCCPCGREVQFGGKAIPVTQTQTSDLLITWLVVVSINTLVARIWDTDQPVCGKLHSSDTNAFNKKMDLMHASCC